MNTKLKGLECHTKKLTALVFLLFVLVLVLTNCGGSGSGTGEESALGGGLTIGEVRPLSFDDNNNARIAFSELSGSENFSLLLFAANVNEGAFDVQLKSLNDPSVSKLLTNPLNSFDSETAGTEDNATTEDFHKYLREEEAQLEGLEPFNPNAYQGSKALTTQNLDSGTCGENMPIKVLNSLSNTSSYQTTCGVFFRQTSQAIYYVDQEIIGSISASILNNIIDEFEPKINLERSLLGSESDVNKDGLITVYFTPAVNRLGNNGGGFVTGYFYGGDLYSATNQLSSNEQEILYICVPGTFNTSLSIDFWASNIAPTVLPHEFQHMISFNHHMFINQGGTEEPWANEGLSHFMEDLSPKTILNAVSAENPSRVNQFLNAPQSAAFTAGTSIAQRGGAYLFFRYLYEQANLGNIPNVASGAELLKNLLDTNNKGVANVEAVTGSDFKGLLLKFYAALQLSNTGLSSDSHYNFLGICLTCTQNDNRNTVLNGIQGGELLSIPVTGSVNSPGGIYFQVSGEILQSAGQGLNFLAPEGMDAGGAIIRLQ